MCRMKKHLKRITTKQDLTAISRDTPDIFDAITADSFFFDSPQDLVIHSDASLWQRLCILHAGDECNPEQFAWNLFHIALMTFDIHPLAEWLNGVLDTFMTDEHLALLPAELRFRLSGAKSCALMSPASQDPFHFSEPALSWTMQALEYNFKESDFHFWIQLEYNLCHYLTIQVRGNLKNHIDRCLNRSRALLSTIQNTSGAQQNILWNVHNIIGIAYSQRHTGNQTENIERSIHHHLLALDLATNESSAKCGSLYNNIGLMYQQRIAGDHAENIENSIEFLNKALAEHRKDGQRFLAAQTLTNLGVSFCERLFGNHQDNIRRAIKLYRTALRYMDSETHAGFRAWTLHNLGVAYQFLSAGRGGINQEHALESYHRALEFRNKDTMPWDWLLTTHNLAELYSIRKRGDRRRNSETAIHLIEDALTVIPLETSPMLWAKTNVHLGTIWSRYQNGNSRFNLEKSAGFFTTALKHLESAALPLQTREAALRLGRVFLRLNRSSNAEKSLRVAARADASRYQQMFMNPSRMREIESGSEIYFLMAESLARQEKHVEALQWMEKGKSRMLNERFRLDETAFRQLPGQRQKEYLELAGRLHSLQYEHFVPGKNVKTLIDKTRKTRDRLERLIEAIRNEHPEFMRNRADSCDDMAKPTEDECFIIYNITDLGTRIFVASTHNGNIFIHSVFNDSFNRENLNGFIRRWSAAKQRVQFDPSIEKIEMWSHFMLKTMKRLSFHLFEPVKNQVHLIKPKHIVFVPHLSLHMLPLHLMPLSRSRSAGLLIDRYSISYIPSLTIGGFSRRRKKHPPSAPLVAISNPTLDLAWADRETRSIRRVFRGFRTVLLKGQNAQREAVESAMTSAAYIHFAGHARFNAIEPYRSYLALAPPSGVRQKPSQTRLITHTISSDPLYLIDIYRKLRFEHHPLVVLSCCESGLIKESISNDEFAGFSAGFLSSGARTVLSSLWVVDDQVTCELMEQFYRNHIQRSMTPSEALRQAQLAIRSRSKYVHPFYWAAFKMNGF
jgi:CHAT domain-containing protein